MESVEIWKDVGLFKGVDYTGFLQASTFGNVRTLNWWIESKKRWHKGAILKQSIDKDGYKTIGFRGKTIRVHQLILQTFEPNPNPKVYTQVNHIDENKTNNHLDNLEWCDAKYNSNYGTHTERVAKSNRLHFIPIVQLNFDGSIVDVHYKKEDIAERSGFNYGWIVQGINNRKNIVNRYFWIRLDKYNELTQNELLNLINETQKRQRDLNKRKESVILLDTHGNFVKQFDSITDAAKYIDCDPSNISAVLRGRANTIKGYKCIYPKDCKNMKLS